MNVFEFLELIVRAPDGKGTGSVSMVGLDGRAEPTAEERERFGPTLDSGSAGGDNNAGKGNQGAGAARPEWATGLPDHMFNADGSVNTQELVKAYNGFRAAMSERGQFPASPKDYKIEWGDRLAEYFPDDTKDPLLDKYRELAHAAGITNEQLQKFTVPLLEEILESGHLGAPVDFDAMVIQLVPKEAKGLDEQGQRQAAGKRIADALAFVDGMVAQKAIPADVADFLVAQLGDDPRGIMALEFMRGRAGPGLALGGRGGGGMSEADLVKRLNDPRGNPDSQEFDREFARETDRMFKEYYGD